MATTYYTRTAVSLHWLIAALIFAALFMGFTMTAMAISPGKLKLYNYHKWVGVTVLVLAMVRLAWRLGHRTPPLLPMPRWQQLAAHGGHSLLYILMFAVPVTGWTYSNASGYPIVYLGLLPLPDLVERNRELAALWEEVHEALAISLAAVIALHVLAALKHVLIDRDGTMRRITTWRAQREKN